VTQPAAPSAVKASAVAKPAAPGVAERVEELCALLIGGATKKEAAEKVFGGNWNLWKLTKDRPDLLANINDAMAVQAHALADEAKQIADTATDSNKARNQVNVRMWLAAKRNPKHYGDRMEVNTNHTISVLSVLSEARGRVERARLQPVMDAEILAPSDLPAIGEAEPAPIDIFS